MYNVQLISPYIYVVLTFGIRYICAYLNMIVEMHKSNTNKDMISWGAYRSIYLLLLNNVSAILSSLIDLRD